tara:strand:+ start:707 stop:1138 length:432 start_codon:yes stop_codon:yes gene_type:complete
MNNLPIESRDNPHFWRECAQWLRDGSPDFSGNAINTAEWRNRLRPSILKEYNHTCAWCGWTQPTHMGCDHVMTRHEGGGNASHNLQLLCRSCNSRKQAVSLPKLAPWPHAVTNDKPEVYQKLREELSDICRHIRGNLRGADFR